MNTIRGNEVDGMQIFVGKAVPLAPRANVSTAATNYGGRTVPVIIGDQQRMINKMCGVSDADFLKHGGMGVMPCKAALDTSSITAEQRMINKMCGVSDEEFIASQGTLDPRKDPSIDDTQRKINALAGVDDETFKKYSGEGG